MKYRYPETKLILRDLDYEYPVICRSEGVYLYDAEGKDYLDASGGAFVASVGHSNAEVIKAMHEQQSKVAYVNGMHFLSEASIELAEKISSESPAGFGRVTFLNSGSEAIEAAVKFCHQLRAERKQTKKTKVIARDPGYHGNTLFALSASARPVYKKLFGSLLSDIPMFEATYEYRSPTESWDKKASEYYFNKFLELIKKEGVDSISTLLIEPICGSSTGGSPPPPGYLKLISDFCKKNDIYIIADEVACGAGRSGSYFASAHFDFNPDVIVLGKAVNGGYAPLSCVVVKDEHMDLIANGSGAYLHAQTYIQSPACAAAGLAVYDHIKKYNLVDLVAKNGVLLKSRLQKIVDSHPHLGFVAGMGYLMGVEFVEDKKTKKPFSRSNKVSEKIHRSGIKNGIVLWPHKAQADGTNGDLVMIAPPFNMSLDEMDELLIRFEYTVKGIEWNG